MQFGFEQPKPYNHARDLAYKIKKHEYKTYSQEAISSEGSPQRQ